jgi:phosphoribosylpyrophosphate synthetase
LLVHVAPRFFLAKLAHEICGCARQTLVQGSIAWDTFEDGFPNLFLKNAAAVKQFEPVVFLASFHSPSVIFQQLSILYSLPAYLAKSFFVVLPYFPTGTMERIDQEGQIATAATMARCISAIPMSQSGPSKLLIYDIHALQERFYFGDSVTVLCESATDLFKASQRNMIDTL